MAEAPALRLAEVVGVLSLATDLAMGQPLEHGLRTALLAGRIATSMGLDAQERSTVHYTSLLHFAGCTAEGQIDARFFGDELAARPQMMAALFGPRARLITAAVRNAHPELPVVQRAGAMARSAVGGLAEFRRWAASHCEVAQLLGDRMGLSAEVRMALGHLYERWDGRGMPGELSGEDIPFAVRIMQVAQDADMAWQRGGEAEASLVALQRAGTGLDPTAVGHLRSLGTDAYAGFDAMTVWDEVLDAEPGPRPAVSGEGLDACLSAVADVADLKSFFTVGHSRSVAELVAGAAQAAGMSEADVTLVRRAGLVHDIGRVAVSATIWAKPGPLNREEQDQVRLRGYHSERIIDASEGLRPIGRLAGSHGERCDGSGHHRGSTARELPRTARLLAAADCYQAMREDRPHREAWPAPAAARELLAEVEAGRLDAEAVNAVLEAAGQAGPRARRPAGLSARECEVLGLLARGLATKQVARQLGIAPKTCDNHIQRVYGKIGVSTRAGAALFAAEHGLLAGQ